MGIFKRKNSLRNRLKALEYYLGIAWADDGYGENEFIDREYGEIKQIKNRIKDLENEKKKGSK